MVSFPPSLLLKICIKIHAIKGVQIVGELFHKPQIYPTVEGIQEKGMFGAYLLPSPVNHSIAVIGSMGSISIRLLTTDLALDAIGIEYVVQPLDPPKTAIQNTVIMFVTRFY